MNILIDFLEKLCIVLMLTVVAGLMATALVWGVMEVIS